MPQIEIAVPAYNCAPWIDEFFESVLAQDYTDWRILTRDDASTDATAARLAHWKDRLGERMTILEGSGERNLGMVGNYDAVLAETTARWVALADPDDVWKPGKLSLTFRAMLKAEATAGSDTPIVVSTDAEVVDRQTRLVARSFWKWSRMNPGLVGVLHRLVVESPVLTTTMIVNRALLDLALPLNGAASYPDWWPALVASLFGRVVCLPDRTILYRRHSSNNTSDPFGSTLLGAIRRFLANTVEPRRRLEGLLEQLAPQAAAFAARYRHRLRGEDLAALEAAASLPALGGWMRRWTVLRHGLWFASPLKNAGLMVLL